MSEYLKYLTDPDYIKAYLKITVSGNERPEGFIYIESEKDKSFWERLLNSFAKNKYEFKIQTKEKIAVRGKRALEALYASANAKALVAVDSDFDYISPNRSDNARVMNRNRYVLQTYAYSVESLSLDVSRVDTCLAQYYYFEPNEHKLKLFLETYSNIIYPVLMKYIFLMDTMDTPPLKENDFHFEIIPSYPVSNYENNSFEDLVQKVSLLDQQLTPMINDIQAFNAFMQLSHFKGLQKDNCYKFIRGHDVEEKIVIPIVNHIKKRQIEQEMLRVKSGSDSQSWEYKQREIRNHFEHTRNFKTLVSVFPYVPDDSIYEKICDHVKSLSL